MSWPLSISKIFLGAQSTFIFSKGFSDLKFIYKYPGYNVYPTHYNTFCGQLKSKNTYGII